MNDSGGTIIFTLMLLIELGLLVFIFAAFWRLFTKAGEPGWAAIVPIYNGIVLLKISGKPIWWIILMFIPFVNFVIWLLVNIALAEKFGKTLGFGIMMGIFPIIGVPILGFGSAEYQS